MEQRSTLLSIIAAGICLVILSGCGAKETEGGLLGGVTGAALGAAVAGDEAEGALIGGTLGALVGSQIGRASDERDRERAAARRAKEQRRREDRLRAEKRDLERQLDKWCDGCKKWFRIKGATMCPRCGKNLIQEKFCGVCGDKFSADTGYKFCARCRVPLKSR